MFLSFINHDLQTRYYNIYELELNEITSQVFIELIV